MQPVKVEMIQHNYTIIATVIANATYLTIYERHNDVPVMYTVLRFD